MKRDLWDWLMIAVCGVLGGLIGTTVVLTIKKALEAL